MALLVTVLVGASFGLGLWLLFLGIRHRTVLPRPESAASVESVQRPLVVATIAGVAAIATYAVTGWISLAVLAFGLVIIVPRAFKNRGQRALELQRSEAIASWTELIRANISGAAGLEQALIVASENGPDVIQPELQRFIARLPRRPLPECLMLLGQDLNSPASDLVVAALVRASTLESRALGPLLSRLSTSIRDNVRMQQRVEVGRTRIRTSARIVVIVTVVTILVLAVIAPQIIAAYSTPAGQLWFLFVLTVFVVAGVMMQRLGNADLGTRFELNPQLLKRSPA